VSRFQEKEKRGELITRNDNINDNTKYLQGKMITPFNVIIFQGQQLLSFLCYHFPMYIFCVIIYVIIFRALSFMITKAVSETTNR
jgi:hypothetical protein